MIDQPNYIININIHTHTHTHTHTNIYIHIADLVGLYILDILTRTISPQQVGLYRYDGLLYIPNSNGPLSSSIQKRIIRAFKFWGFKIEISSNIKIANFLDVTLDLSNNSYKPFIKPNQNPSYINVNSNHPKNIIKQIPKAVNLRIGKLSANEKIFKESSKRYIYIYTYIHI